MNAELLKQWEEIRCCLTSEINDFTLSQGALDDLINNFNIKVQKCSTGYICFKGYNIGAAKNGITSGAAFCNYLKAHGLSPDSDWHELLRCL